MSHFFCCDVIIPVRVVSAAVFIMTSLQVLKTQSHYRLHNSIRRSRSIVVDDEIKDLDACNLVSRIRSGGVLGRGSAGGGVGVCRVGVGRVGRTDVEGKDFNAREIVCGKRERIDGAAAEGEGKDDRRATHVDGAFLVGLLFFLALWLYLS